MTVDTPGIRATAAATEVLNPELGPVMMSSALTALSRLVFADSDSDAPRTAIVDTSAIPTIRAAAVCAVRRGLRIEFSRPILPGVPSSAASGRPSIARHRPRDDRGQHAGSDEHGHRAEPDQQDRRCGQPCNQCGDATGRRKARRS